MAGVDWKLRARVFVQRLTQPTCACIVCMSAPSFANLLSAAHWKIAFQTGIGTGLLALLLSFTSWGRLFARRYSNAVVMGLLTALADAWSHPGRLPGAYGEALVTGLVSGLIVLASSFVSEPLQGFVRKAWSRVRASRASP